jgi:hypothetical protein
VGDLKLWSTDSDSRLALRCKYSFFGARDGPDIDWVTISPVVVLRSGEREELMFATMFKIDETEQCIMHCLRHR